MEISADKVVSIDYTLRNSEKEVLDQSQPGEPLHYLHGHGNLISGLEDALLGKSEGDQVEAVIPPAEAYGEYNPEMIHQVPRDMFQGVDTIEPGMAFQAQSDQGVQRIVVKEVADDVITIDANHELAGETLYFDVTVQSVRDASAEELDHGHVHGPGGHHH
jgi:FKBP-type peptidyl-prolyl cis-trans isomerase SlyD